MIKKYTFDFYMSFKKQEIMRKGECYRKTDSIIKSEKIA